MAVEQRKRLGRGLDALLGGLPEPDYSGSHYAGRQSLPVGLLSPNPRNPRGEFRAEDMEELAASIRQHGIVQPIVVRALGGSSERYEIIAGERRWRAAQSAGLHDVPVAVLDVSERQALELAIVENVQRADLKPLEEARGYQALIDEFGYTQADLGAAVGKSRVHVTNTLRLLRLAPPVLALLEAGALSAGHGRALLGARDPEGLARMVVERNISVRETERLAQLPDAKPRILSRRHASRSADITALEKELAGILGLRVQLRHDESGHGEVRISYATLEQFEEVCRKLRR